MGIAIAFEMFSNNVKEEVLEVLLMYSRLLKLAYDIVQLECTHSLFHPSLLVNLVPSNKVLLMLKSYLVHRNINFEQKVSSRDYMDLKLIPNIFRCDYEIKYVFSLLHTSINPYIYIHTKQR